jgi:hypothetical protein
MLNQATQKARPPYVEFEEREHPEGSGALVDFAILHPLGSKDTVEKIAKDWLAHNDKLAERGEYPREWAQFFREQYNGWKAGQDCEAVIGTHVKAWPGISPAQANILVAARCRTVEDLADAPEELLQRIGMGARNLQTKARAFVDAKKDGGAAEELAMLRQKTADQENQIAELNKKVDTLVAASESGQAAQERPRKRA